MSSNASSVSKVRILTWHARFQNCPQDTFSDISYTTHVSNSTNLIEQLPIVEGYTQAIRMKYDKYYSRKVSLKNNEK